jgi:hypothetical protein
MRKTTTSQRWMRPYSCGRHAADILQFDLGVPFVLDPQDESPFMKFGYVYPGQTIPALYNNLVRAPLFRHKPYLTDFLVIKFFFLLKLVP